MKMAPWLGLDQSLVPQLVRYSLISAVLHIYTIRKIGPLHAGSAIFISLTTLTILARQWLSLVTKYAPEPYLDEVFHIPQAQVYCDGKYDVWDDKITTPPGLYVLTLLANKLSGFPCSAYYLRLFNVEVISYLAIAAVISRVRLEQLRSKEDPQVPLKYSAYAIWTGINVALFPVLFFFSGLYYTDVVSTFVVLLAYTNHLSRVSQYRTSLINDAYTLFLGLLALCMRQTNIFWVVVYMGGLEVVHGVKELRPKPVNTPTFTTLSQQIGFYAWRYSLGDIHDPHVGYAKSPIDLVLCVASIGVAVLSNLPKVIFQRIWPHLVVLGSFVCFVTWNGGVVLGDKSNHVATLHLAQMLYIWPLFAFFSAPLFIPQLLNHIWHTLFPPKPLETIDCRPNGGPSPKEALESTQSNQLKIFNRVGSSHVILTVILLVGALAAAALIVKFNTIIHPFTLADNRHYMFYVFRYTILRAWWVRYALVPVYVICGSLCWGALQGEPASKYHGHPEWMQTPFDGPTPALIPRPQLSQPPDLPDVFASLPPPTSSVLILLLATALSLVTAPLVEPRYFILPWVFWRLLVPAHLGVPFAPEAEWRLMPALETIWFLLINAATMFVFVTRPFYWKAPDGELLDGGRVQRFMW
ncbi:glycosyltransferase family 59 protein [Annulohypoxylon truncatum]|uniref:glycosyltransferase family 59 protein n=1 Tax=Annulohypoxylon truncatum TaxID=327061 RepID=UPI002007F44D|nr:glycosyltransferase family 59 protein [Annulohypoxylon truncatum]KAI1208341.1 glycosyltransferase family 59 protein [Annulohypoxylon truncatum]